MLFGGVARVMAQLSKPYPDRPLKTGGRRAVETFDTASILIELNNGASGIMALNRSAWGRKGRIGMQVFGSKGTITYDQERMNEFGLFTASGNPAEQGFRTVLTAPVHAPYDRFIPAPGHGLGFNELKIIECHELLEAIAGKPARLISFTQGLGIERAVHAMAQSHREGSWSYV